MLRQIKITPDIELSYLGPSIEKGPLPALFYFALSAEESLTLSPYSHPAEFLCQYPMRIFSMTLPAHGEGLDPTKAIPVWAEQMREGRDIISPFLDKATFAISHLLDQQVLFAEKTALAGLSRGAFIATHLAARIPKIPFLLGFAPLTQLTFSKDFQDLQNSPLARSLNLTPQIKKLIHTRIRYYIGNHDTLVGTENCFQFVHALSQIAYENRIRSPHVELIIGPSIGHKGHGTSTETFKAGSLWIAKNLGVLNE